MLSALTSLFSRPLFQQEAHEAYASLVASARRPFFYTEGGVPDTLDGRFDVIVLHLFLLIHRLRPETKEGVPEFLRALQEAFFADMDRSVREMGVSDTGVGKRIKQMAQAFYGRIQAYEQSFADPDSFEQSLRRNLYRGALPPAAAVSDVSAYCRRALLALEGQRPAEMICGRVHFSE
jgi:cytochrome b pre-mRNA-processing protein 3